MSVTGPALFDYDVILVAKIDAGADVTDTVSVSAGDTAAEVATALRAATLTGVTLGGTGADVTFTPTAGGTELTKLSVVAAPT